MAIPLVNLNRQHDELHDEIREAIDHVLERGDFILGAEVTKFEQEFADYCETKHCIGVGSGLDALTLTLRGLGVGKGDEVIVPANTFVATALAVQHTGATPVLVDHDPETYVIDTHRLSAAMNARTKAIIPVHLYGHPADMDTIQSFADEHGLITIEDAAQAHGARYKGHRCGSLAHAGAFSFYPGKNLGAVGDAGAIVTDDDSLAQWLRTARNYGSAVKHKHTLRGFNTRLDTIQAAVLRVKLRYLDEWNARRRWLACEYGKLLGETDIVLPVEHEDVEHVYHLYVVRHGLRDALLSRLQQHGIHAGIHYPAPIQTQTAFARGCMTSGPLTNSNTMCDQLLSLPLCPFISLDEVEEVAHVITETLALAKQGVMKAAVS